MICRVDDVCSIYFIRQAKIFFLALSMDLGQSLGVLEIVNKGKIRSHGSHETEATFKTQTSSAKPKSASRSMSPVCDF